MERLRFAVWSWLVIVAFGPVSGLAADSAPAPGVESATTYFLGMGRELGQGGKVEDTVFMLGKHTVYPQTNLVVETQVVVSKKSGITEETLRYDIASRKLVIFLGKRPVGEGEFRTDGDKFQWKKCHYKIDLKELGPNLTLEGTDTFGTANNEAGLFATSDAKLSLANGEVKSRVSGDLKVIDADLYEMMRLRLLARAEGRTHGKGPAE